MKINITPKVDKLMKKYLPKTVKALNRFYDTIGQDAKKQEEFCIVGIELFEESSDRYNLDEILTFLYTDTTRQYNYVIKRCIAEATFDAIIRGKYAAVIVDDFMPIFSVAINVSALDAADIAKPGTVYGIDTSDTMTAASILDVTNRINKRDGSDLAVVQNVSTRLGGCDKTYLQLLTNHISLVSRAVNSMRKFIDDVYWFDVEKLTKDEFIATIMAKDADDIVPIECCEEYELLIDGMLNDPSGTPIFIVHYEEDDHSYDAVLINTNTDGDELLAYLEYIANTYKSYDDWANMINDYIGTVPEVSKPYNSMHYKFINGQFIPLTLPVEESDH